MSTTTATFAAALANFKPDTSSKVPPSVQRAVALAQALQERATSLQTAAERKQQAELDRTAAKEKTKERADAAAKAMQIASDIACGVFASDFSLRYRATDLGRFHLRLPAVLGNDLQPIRQLGVDERPVAQPFHHPGLDRLPERHVGRGVDPEVEGLRQVDRRQVLR